MKLIFCCSEVVSLMFLISPKRIHQYLAHSHPHFLLIGFYLELLFLQLILLRFLTDYVLLPSPLLNKPQSRSSWFSRIHHQPVFNTP